MDPPDDAREVPDSSEHHGNEHGSKLPRDKEFELRTALVGWLRARRESGSPLSAVMASVGVSMELATETADDSVVPQVWDSLEDFFRSAPVETLLVLVANISVVDRVHYRQKLPEFRTLESVVAKINSEDCRNVLVLTGAGISVSCGIPDFRSDGGIYEMVEKSGFEFADDPQLIFDIEFFRDNPKPFFTFSKNLMPGNYTPSPAHRFIKALEDRGKLLRNYTQNIDTLEAVAGIEKVVYCHGSFKSASCLSCRRKVDVSVIRADIENDDVPYCTACTDDERGNIMKPDIIFFGEALGPSFQKHLEEDLKIADLLIVMGSSLRVRPVCLIPALIAENTPQILINRELVGQPHEFDVFLQGDCDEMIFRLCEKLGWDELSPICKTTEDVNALRPHTVAKVDLKCDEIPPPIGAATTCPCPPPAHSGSGEWKDGEGAVKRRKTASDGCADGEGTEANVSPVKESH